MSEVFPHIVLEKGLETGVQHEPRAGCQRTTIVKPVIVKCRLSPVGGAAVYGNRGTMAVPVRHKLSPQSPH